MIHPTRSNPGRLLVACAFLALGSAAHGAGDRPEKRRSTAAATPATPAPSPGGPATSLEAFAIVAERNIFNPNRVGPVAAVVEEKPPRIDEISLVGTMQYDKGQVAFFASTTAEFNQNLREGEAIAGFTIKRIGADGVELLRDDKSLPLKVSEQLRRREGGEWTVYAAPSAVAPARGGAAVDDVRAAAAAAASAVPSDASDVLKRLLQKREKELKK